MIFKNLRYLLILEALGEIIKKQRFIRTHQEMELHSVFFLKKTNSTQLNFLII